jgi:hypothetical protein
MDVFSAALSCCCVPLMPIIDSLTAPALLQLPPSAAVSTHLEFDQITRDGGEISLQARGECKLGIWGIRLAIKGLEATRRNVEMTARKQTGG